MNWIDLSDMKEPAVLPKGWSFHSLKKHMEDDETARCGESILITKCSSKIEKGSMVAVRDHVNLSGINPLRGHNNDDFGVRFPDMSHPYEIPAGFPGESVVIRAGQDEEHPYDAIDASEIVYQTILAKHQLKTVYALIYGENVEPNDILKLFLGD